VAERREINMKIQGENNPLMRIQKTQAKTSCTGPKLTKPTLSNSVEISRLASELSGIEEKLKQVPDVREEKVAELKQRIESGNYQVDLNKLAEILIRYL